MSSPIPSIGPEPIQPQGNQAVPTGRSWNGAGGRWLGAVGTLLCGLSVAGCGGSAPAPAPAAASPVRRIHGPAECMKCHSVQSEHYLETGHARTLSRAAGPEFLERFSAQKAELQFDNRAHQVELRHQDGQVYVSSRQFPLGLPIEWTFGSGRHAQTPVTAHVNPNSRQTESIQFFTTWYRDNGIQRTIGQGHQLGEHGLSTIGVPTDVAGTIRCFRCHISDMAIDGSVIQMDHIVGGVLCSRCHTGLDQHVADSSVPPSGWSELSPRESVVACGECHRTGEEAVVFLDRDAPGNTARFAPMGILKSACFLQQQAGTRFDCMTCHDPHQPMQVDPTFYNSKCAECHLPDGLPQDCRAEGLAGNCVGCHMPKVDVEGVISFSDHWIRRPDKPEPAAAAP